MPKAELKEKYSRVGEAPFDSLRKMMTTIHKDPEGGYIQFTKGAPDCVLDACTKYLMDGEIHELTPEVLKKIQLSNKGMADR